MPERTNSAFFTICSANYLPTAKILIDTIEENTTSDIFLIICDKKRDSIEEFFIKNRVHIIYVEDLEIENFREFIYRYSILEINTSIKPFVFEHLFKLDYEKVFYFDPDISIEDSLDVLKNILDSSNAVVTPHIMSPYTDSKNPTMADISNSGIYNLGFLGLKSCDDVNKKFLPWWQENCRFNCFSDIEKGLFTDQKFCDYLPSFVTNTNIYYGPDANIAYWNLHEREITEKEGSFFSNSKKVLFFHFSGIVFDEKFKFKRLSKHENRFGKKISFVLMKKIEQYLSQIKINTQNFNKLGINDTYMFDNINGIYLDEYKRIYLRNLSRKNPEIDFDVITDEWFYNPASEFSKNTGILRIFLGLYFSRKDLQNAFDLSRQYDAESFLAWIKHEIDAGNLPVHWSNYLKNDLLIAGIGVKLKRKLFRLLKKMATIIPILPTNPLMNRFKSNVRSFLLEESFLKSKNPYAKKRIFPKKDTTDATKDGLNIFGYFDSNSGVGNGARLMREVLNESSIKTSVFNVDAEDNSKIKSKSNSQKVWDISLFHINADQTPNCLPFVSMKAQETYKIGFWAWELERFPSPLLDSGRFLNDLWVPSNFIADAIIRSCNFDPKVIPHPVRDHKEGSFGVSDKFNIGEGFILTTIFDLDSYIDRKNPFGAINAFIEASKNMSFRDEAKLIIKVNGSMGREKVLNKINMIKERNDLRIIVIDDFLSEEEMIGLRNITDLFLSLHRSEGFGLNLIENMNAGNLVIGTNYSGNTDFMNDNNSLLVDFEMVPVGKDQYPFGEGQFWAEPKISDAAEKIIWAFENRLKAHKLSSNAQSYINENFSIESISKSVKAQIDLI